MAIQTTSRSVYFGWMMLLIAVTTAMTFAQPAKVVSSYGPINQDTTFEQIQAERMAVKVERAAAHKKMLETRYDLAKRVSPDVMMSGGKPIPTGVTAKLKGVTWEELNALSPEQLCDMRCCFIKNAARLKNQFSTLAFSHSRILELLVVYDRS